MIQGTGGKSPTGILSIDPLDGPDGPDGVDFSAMRLVLREREQAVNYGGQRPKAAWLQQLDRIEAKLETLLKALADEKDEPPNMGLHTGTEAGSREHL